MFYSARDSKKRKAHGCLGKGYHGSPAISFDLIRQFQKYRNVP